MAAPQPADGPENRALELIRWLGPMAALLVLGAVAYVLHGQLLRLRLPDIGAHLREIPRGHLLAALALTGADYCLISGYDLLALRYVRKRLRYARVLFTAFIAAAFGHNLGFSAFTGGAIRLRLYTTAGITAVEVATITVFYSLSIALGLTLLAGLALSLAPAPAATALHLAFGTAPLGVLLLAAVAVYALWAAFSRRVVEVRGWALRAPGTLIGWGQIALSALDLSLAASVLWLLLPPDAHIGLLPFLGAYVIALTAGIISHVPGGIGVFETIILLMLHGAPVDALLGALLAFRAVYYFAPLVVGAALFGYQELNAQRRHLVRARNSAAMYVRPVAPQVSGTLTFIAGAMLLMFVMIPGIDSRLALAPRWLAAVRETASLGASLIGLGLLIVSRALFRRVRPAWRLARRLLAAGILVAALQGLAFEEAPFLALALAVLTLGRGAFYRPTSILDERFSPIWIASLLGTVLLSVWTGLLLYRHTPYDWQLWWTFTAHAGASRMLRASLTVSVLATGYLLVNLLRPTRPEPSAAGPRDLERAREIIERGDQSLANAALSGDKRLLFSDAGDVFLMYQVAGRSWVALGDPVGERAGVEEVVRRFQEMAERHGAHIVFYQTGAQWLPLYEDLGLAPLPIGEAARVPLARFALEEPSHAVLRHAHRRARRTRISFEVVPAGRADPLMPALKRLSDAWLVRHSTAERRFSVGYFSPRYLGGFPLAVVRHGARPVAFANLWVTGTRAELALDLIRFGPEAPPGIMDYLLIETMRWGRAQGFQWIDLGMAPLGGRERDPLAPAWHDTGNFVFPHGEHFERIELLRQYLSRFDPRWEPRYLLAHGGITLPRVLVEVAALIGGRNGFR